jgi:hypothetical protein
VVSDFDTLCGNYRCANNQLLTVNVSLPMCLKTIWQDSVLSQQVCEDVPENWCTKTFTNCLNDSNPCKAIITYIGSNVVGTRTCCDVPIPYWGPNAPVYNTSSETPWTTECYENKIGCNCW